MLQLHQINSRVSLSVVIGEFSSRSLLSSEHERSVSLFVCRRTEFLDLRSNSVINKSILSDEIGDGELRREIQLCAEVWLVHLVPFVAHVDSAVTGPLRP